MLKLPSEVETAIAFAMSTPEISVETFRNVAAVAWAAGMNEGRFQGRQEGMEEMATVRGRIDGALLSAFAELEGFDA